MSENSDFSLFGIKAVDKSTKQVREGTWFYNVVKAINNIDRSELEEYDPSNVFVKIPNLLEFIYIFDIFNWVAPKFVNVHLDITAVDPYELAIRKKRVKIESEEGNCNYLSISNSLLDTRVDEAPQNDIPVTKDYILNCCLPLLKGNTLSIEYAIYESELENGSMLQKSFDRSFSTLLRFSFEHKTKVPDFVCKVLLLQNRSGIDQMFWPSFPQSLAATNEAKKVLSADEQREALKKGMRTLRLDGWDKIKRGLTTIDEIIRVTQEQEI